MAKEKKVVIKTGQTNGHTHSYSPGDTWTSESFGHRHPLRKGRDGLTRKRIWNILGAQGHVHTSHGE